MSEDETQTWWATTWPIDKEKSIELVVALLLVIGMSAIVGLVLFRWLEPNVLTNTDESVAEWFVDERTDTVNDVAHWGATVSDTFVKIILSVLVAGFMLWRWRRWHEAVIIGGTLIFEATAFIITSVIVGRPRPDVEQLLESPVDTSFPSGHVAAATVYGAFAIVVFWHTRAVWARVAITVVCVAAALVVAWARMLQGMHFLSDVVAGIVLGIVSLVVFVRIVGAPHDAETVLINDAREPDRRPADAA